MKRKTVIGLLLVTLLAAIPLLSGCGSKDTSYEVPDELTDMVNSYLDNVDSKVAYDIAVKLSEDEDFLGSELGGRNAGSDEEHAAADWLASQMKEIGLTDVSKDGVSCDTWQNNGATLTINGKDYPVYSGYATASADNLKKQIVFVNDGTMYDYDGLNVKDKIVLINIDQRSNWWITYPMLEAQFQGAAAIISANVGGFAQEADDALNAQDICGPVGIPCVSIGVADSKEIQGLIKKGKTTATLDVDNEVTQGGTTYNVIGKIKGTSSDHQIIVGAHYDVHFGGFQDDSCGIGLVLSMAKAMVESGYTPENDIVFCLHGAEEWGTTNSPYDWTVGAWENINTLHPDWVGKTLSFINFELPAYEFAEYTSTYSAPEMYTMLNFFTNEYPLSPDPEGCFADGVKTEGYQTYTYSDDFSYYVAGVPSTVNGFLLQEDMETVFPFYENIYHSQYDTKDIYNEKVMTFNTKYYGALAMYIDQMPALYLDFTSQVDRFKDATGDDATAIMEEAGVDMDAYQSSLDGLKTSASALKSQVEQVNDDYMKAWIDQDKDKMAELKAQGKKLTDQELKAFKFAQKSLINLMYERPVVPHEAPIENITLSRSTIDALKEGDVVTAADEYAWKINNVLEWYNMYFSPEVMDILDKAFTEEGNPGNLYWGTGIGFTQADVEEATRSIMARYDEKDGNYDKEIAVYKSAIKDQVKRVKSLSNQEIKDITSLTDML